MTEGVFIKRGSGRHAGACLELARDLGEFFNDDALKRMSTDLRDHLLLAAEDGLGKILGFATLSARTEDATEITWMAVRREQWRRGIGTALLAEAERSLIRKGVPFLFVKTLADTVDHRPYEGTRAFYRSAGFRLLDVIDPFPGWAPGNPCAIYVRAIG